MRPSHVLETCLYAEDLEAAGGFYGGVLGFEALVEEPGRHVFYRCGPAMLLVFNPAATGDDGDLPPHGSEGAEHVCFAIPHSRVDAWRRHLESHGVAIEQTKVWSDEAVSLYFRDPAGNLVELVSPRLWGLPDVAEG